MEKFTHYYCHFGHSTATKNKLKDAFYEYLKTFDGHLFDASDVVKLQKAIIYRSEVLNEEFKRCKPLEISFYTLGDKKAIRISGFYCVSFVIYGAIYQVI
jgi:hypothetical protein